MIGEEAVDMTYSSVEVNELTQEYVDSYEPENDPKCKLLQYNEGIHYILIHAGELDSLCCEIEGQS